MKRQKLVSFQLTMPNIGSWNGQWSRNGNNYFIVRPLSHEQLSKIEFKDNKASFYYDFCDGWGARVLLEIVDSKEAAKRRKSSDGFCDYDWMVNEIMELGRIRTRSERIQLKSH